MALPTFLGVNLVTPRGVVAHTDTDSVQAPGEQGEFELLPGHVPFLTALRPGLLTIGTKVPVQYAVSSGYLRVDPTGSVEILVEQAQAKKDIDVEAARAELKQAEADIARWGDKPRDGDLQNLEARAAWARARIDTVAH
jgi:F-type H+-transporting ATPase subunit epsilon